MTSKKSQETYRTKKHTYHVKGTTVLIEMEKVGDNFGGLITITDAHKEQLQTGHMKGYVRAIGKFCWFDKGEPYAKIGDKVVFKRYSGTDVNRTLEGALPKDEPLYRFMPDYAIEGVIEDNN